MVHHHPTPHPLPRASRPPYHTTKTQRCNRTPKRAWALPADAQPCWPRRRIRIGKEAWCYRWCTYCANLCFFSRSFFLPFFLGVFFVFFGGCWILTLSKRGGGGGEGGWSRLQNRSWGSTLVLFYVLWFIYTHAAMQCPWRHRRLADYNLGFEWWRSTWDGRLRWVWDILGFNPGPSSQRLGIASVTTLALAIL